MLFKTIALSLFAAVAAAQNSTLTSLVSQLPECASTCFSSSASTAGCATTDFDCLCGDKKQAFINAIGPCLILDNSCSSDELSDVTDLAGEICTEVASNPSDADTASASAVVASAIGTATASASASATESGNAAKRTDVSYGVMGAAVAFAALAL